MQMAHYTDHDMDRRCMVQVRLYMGLLLASDLIVDLVQLQVLAHEVVGFRDMVQSVAAESAAHGLHHMTGN